jgi:hypothetical protein
MEHDLRIPSALYSRGSFVRSYPRTGIEEVGEAPDDATRLSDRDLGVFRDDVCRLGHYDDPRRMQRATEEAADDAGTKRGTDEKDGGGHPKKQ